MKESEYAAETAVGIVVTYDALCDGLSDGVDLRCVATAADSYADVGVGCAVIVSIIYTLHPCSDIAEASSARSPSLSARVQYSTSFTSHSSVYAVQ